MDNPNELTYGSGAGVGPAKAPHGSRRELSLQPDVMLPVQYLRQRTLPARGERALLAAVLEEAILSFQKNFVGRTTRQRRLFREAEEWIMSEDRSELMTFGRICEIVGLDPDYVRLGLHKWRERELERLQTESISMIVTSGQQSADLAAIREVA